MTIGFTDKTIPAYNDLQRTAKRLSDVYETMRLRGPAAERVAHVVWMTMQHIQDCETFLQTLGVDASAVDRADPVGWALRAISEQKAR